VDVIEQQLGVTLALPAMYEAAVLSALGGGTPAEGAAAQLAHPAVEPVAAGSAEMDLEALERAAIDALLLYLYSNWGVGGNEPTQLSVKCSSVHSFDRDAPALLASSDFSSVPGAWMF
jgi:hypothetical protein